MAVGEQVGHDKLCYASRKNRVVVVVRKDESHVHHLIERDIFIKENFVQGSPLSVPSTRITVPGVLPFIPNKFLENELHGFGK